MNSTRLIGLASIACTAAAITAAAAMNARRNAHHAAAVEQQLTDLAWTQEGVRLTTYERASLRARGLYTTLVVDLVGEDLDLAVLTFARDANGRPRLTVATS